MKYDTLIIRIYTPCRSLVHLPDILIDIHFIKERDITSTLKLLEPIGL